MKQFALFLTSLTLIAGTTTSCGRKIRTAEDITPGRVHKSPKMDWRYGAADIRIQTTEDQKLQ